MMRERERERERESIYLRTYLFSIDQIGAAGLSFVSLL